MLPDDTFGGWLFAAWIPFARLHLEVHHTCGISRAPLHALLKCAQTVTSCLLPCLDVMLSGPCIELLQEEAREFARAHTAVASAIEVPALLVYVWCCWQIHT